MRGEAFRVLGIAPTNDQQAIHAAFLRLARIFHPDRFAGLSEDVRTEAEQRMKQATSAYRVLRADRVITLPATKPVKSFVDQERERRAAITARRELAELDRVRWTRWDGLEREARDRAEIEAKLAEQISAELGAEDTLSGKPMADLPAPTSTLGGRLAEARRVRGLAEDKDEFDSDPRPNHMSLP